MEKKKLQRIIGISVVVAFVIVLIPFLFEKKELPQQQAAALVSPASPEQQSADDNNNLNSSAEDNGITPITPPIASNTQSAAPTTVNPTNTNNPSVPSSTQTNMTSQNTSEVNTVNATDTSSEALNASSAPAPVSADNSLPAEDKVEVVPAIATEVNNDTVPQVTAEQTTTKTEVKPNHYSHKSLIAKKTNHFSEKNLANLKKPAWVVQMGSFKNKSNANRLVNQLRTAGFKAFTHVVTSSTGVVRTRVYIGPEFKQASAVKLSTQIENIIKLRGFIVPYKPMSL